MKLSDCARGKPVNDFRTWAICLLKQKGTVTYKLDFSCKNICQNKAFKAFSATSTNQTPVRLVKILFVVYLAKGGDTGARRAFPRALTCLCCSQFAPIIELFACFPCQSHPLVSGKISDCKSSSGLARRSGSSWVWLWGVSLHPAPKSRHSFGMLGLAELLRG